MNKMSYLTGAGYALLAASAGLLTAYQPGLNAKFAAHAGARVYGGVINFAVGLCAMLAVLAVMRPEAPEPNQLSRGPWWMWVGGMCGAYFVTMALVLVPRMGAANYLAGMIAGQLIGSVVIDHFGQMGLAVQPFSIGRAAGILLILAGVLCVRMF